MLETAEVGHKVAKAVYARKARKLREALLEAQFELKQANAGPALLLISGVEGGGRHETAQQLTEWMDPRSIRVVAFGMRSDEESARPAEWRYWRALPGKGRIGIFMNAWYRELLAYRLQGRIDRRTFAERLVRIRELEDMLSAEGLKLFKFWIHLSKEQQKQRFHEIESDPENRWRMTKEDWRSLRSYNHSRELWEHMLSATSTGVAPWYVVEGADRRYREITVAEILLEGMREIAAAKPAKTAAPAPPSPAVAGNVEIIRKLDLRLRLTQKAYEDDLAKYQRKLAKLTRRDAFGKRALVLAFEGSDAAGKGGAIRRVANALDARQYEIVQVAAPTQEERDHPYLWRFWRAIPAHGEVAIFDRTWYGRVLVERVEGFCAQPEWIRAYDEINQFEAELARSDIIVCKFWLQVSRREQLKRFRERQKTSFKRFKITEEDWRNRKKWDLYQQAVADMIERTSSDVVPWTLVEAEDKRYARVKVLRTICERLERAFG
jgi:polyphosphate:AMP phosphotransferase